MTVKVKELLELANHVEKLPSGRFNFNTWVGKDWKGLSDLSCGTTACILGWAAVLMPELGMQLIQVGKNKVAAVVLKGERLHDDYRCHGQSLETAMTVFGLDELQASFLFTPDHEYNGMDGLHEEATPQEAAEHVRRFVKSLNREAT